MHTDVTVGDVFNYMDQWAPFSSAEEWDNTGLLVGDREKRVTKVIVALDITPDVAEQAKAKGAELIISHHPVIFRPISKLDSKDAPYLLARYDIAAIAAHTNLDIADGGVNDCLAEALEIGGLSFAAGGIIRVGTLRREMQPDEFAAYTTSRLGVPSRAVQWANGGRPVRTVALCAGSGGDYLHSLPPQADAYVTGELRYHDWPASPACTIVAAGHYHTEIPVLKTLVKRLSEQFPSLSVTQANGHCPYITLI